MQTFLPYPDFEKSARCLDIKRCRKQVVEAYQIINTLTGNSKGWKNHPIINLWRDNVPALKDYFNIFLEISKERKTNYKAESMKPMIIEEPIVMPKWFGREDFHASHRSNLLAKNYEYYIIYGWKERPGLSYIWS